MQDDDDFDPVRLKMLQRELDVMSIEALQDYIAEKQREIKEAQAMIEKKQAARGAADAVFKN